jgi:molybdopterin converting factor subunit 1
MKVKIRFFAAPREALQRGEVEQELPSGATVAELVQALVQSYPVLAPYMGRAKVAINQKYAAPDTVLHEGDEVACLPPVGGG